ncbi:adenosine receptor A2b-like [Anneissia japonica]|uniref:adenosine receptor A2b-like n=1 Tax=Anneissia japonica TaxID=1529436 RepID=UPI001425B437|nr:adenosine receptor A2b-like [Anneissia japonica]
MACLNETYNFTHEYSDFLKKHSTLYISIVLTICFPLVVNNLLTIIVITKTKLLRKKHNIFVLSLAVCDLLIGILDVVLVICLHNQSAWVAFIFISILLHTLTLTSILNVTAVAVERSLALVFMPLHYASNVTTKRLSIVCIFLWVVPLASVPILYIYSEPEISLWLFSMICLFGMIATAIFYVIIYQTICKSDERLAAMGVHDVNRSKKVLKTFSIITGLLILLWTPFLVISIWVSFPKIACFFGESYIIIYIISHLMTIVNSMINPLIYWCRLSDFRKAFSDTFGKCGVPLQLKVDT